MTSRELKLLAKEIVAEQMRYEVVGVDEAAKILGVAPKTVRNNLADIPHGKYNGRLRFSKADLYSLIFR